ncbi:MAG: epoxide hydrolase N-terminal domain-containing protein, partial [Gammaproteobacteria bacterium]
MQPFTINFSQAEIDTIRSRVKAFPWHEMPDDGGWAYGTNLDYLRELCDYWVNH